MYFYKKKIIRKSKKERERTNEREKESKRIMVKSMHR